MNPLLLLGAIERADSGKAVTAGVPEADRVLDRGIADRVTVLGQFSASEIAALWPAATGWGLHDHGFSVYCPYCQNGPRHGHWFAVASADIVVSETAPATVTLKNLNQDLWKPDRNSPPPVCQ